uniref:Rad21/Rec8-like protein N-terminal domain-containing protein n=3 Tax=Hemiselmis andersenii TaxID=464988 RepID=A0A6U4LIV4_HEMAN|mmetsp:Transcript_15288/g.37066  ORF Transcript_15288/g.37066 Transcript_15288/m.37066 type:complete len:586 (+) Transcript_15288:226-1983(+)
MFYSANVLQKKGPLGAVWIAAHHDVRSKLSKVQILNTDIAATAGQIESPTEEMALRLSSHLLVGLSRIYTRKVQFLFTDCNEALSKITMAFRPGTVDIGPVSKAQLKAITMDEPAGVTDLDLDLTLDIDPGQWLSGGANMSQPSTADITLPEMGTAGQSSQRWEDEDPLLFGAAPDGGDNPLDVNYDMNFDDAEVMRDEGEDKPEDPEMRRDSDSQHFAPGDVDMDDYPAPDMPDFDVEQPHPTARPSGVHSELPATPIHASGNDESGMLDFDTPVIEMKKGKQAKKRRANQMDDATEISKNTMRTWIHDADAVKDTLREPRTIPKTAQEAAKRRKDELLRKNRLAEAQAQEPLCGLIGPALAKAMAAMGPPQIVVQQAKEGNSRKRKSAGLNDTSNAGEDESMQNATAQDDAWDPQQPDFDQPYDTGYDEGMPVQEYPDEVQGEGEEGVVAPVVDSVFGDYVKDDDEEEGGAEEEGLHGKVTEQGERTKKVILMLQKCFSHDKAKSDSPASKVSAPEEAPAPKPLEFHKIIKGSAGEKPSKHTAAVAFFELLGLQAKGMVHLEQSEAFGNISIGQTPLLLKAKV